VLNNIYIFDETVTLDGENSNGNNRGNSLFKVIKEIKEKNSFSFSIESFDQVYPDNRPNCNCNNRYYKQECTTCKCISSFRKITNEDSIIFIHTTNQCFYGFTKQFVKTNKYWIVCYSGGGQSSAEAYNDLIEAYPDAKNIDFFGLSPNAIVGDINSKWDIKGVVEAVLEGKTDPFEFLERKGTPHLIALSILCQGYLAAHWEELWENNIESVLKGWGNLPNELKEKVKGKKGETENIKTFWLSVINDTNNVRNELSDGNDKVAVNALLDAIDRKNEVDLKDNWGIGIVKDANEALLGILKGNEKQC